MYQMKKKVAVHLKTRTKVLNIFCSFRINSIDPFHFIIMRVTLKIVEKDLKLMLVYSRYSR